MQSTYFSAILDFYTEYDENITIYGLPKFIEEIIEKKTDIVFINGDAKVKKEDAPKLFKMGSPHFNHSKQVDIMIELNQLPFKKPKINEAYAAALFDIDSRAYFKKHENWWSNILVLSRNIDFWENFLHRKADPSRGVILSDERSILHLMEAVKPHLLWKKEEIECLSNLMITKNDDCIKEMKDATHKNINIKIEK